MPTHVANVSTVNPSPDGQRALSCLVAAFMADPFVRWIYPRADLFIAHGAEIFDSFGGGAFNHDTAFEIDDFAGVALWVPPGGSAADDERVESLLEQTVDEDRLAEVAEALEGFEAFHPKEPCWYLPLIGVDPACQGRGLGGQLMKHVLAKVDAEHLPAYLESSNPANISLYERHGFEVIGLIETKTSPKVHPMLRAAR